MKDWNVVVTIFQEGFRRAMRALEKLGDVARSPYHNVLVMKSDDPERLLSAIEQATEEDPALYDAISRVAPASHCFEFHDAEDFHQGALAIARGFLPQLAGKSFYVRLHRRGLRRDLISPEAERALDGALLAALADAGTPGHVTFEDPDAVIAIDTIDTRAGMALWSRDQLQRHHLLRPD